MAEQKEDENTSPVEIITAEQVNSVYHNGSLIQPDYELFRLNTPKGRVYFIFTDPINQADPIFFGGTGMVGKELRQSEYLIEDISKHGTEYANRRYYRRMLFGSFSHSRLADYMMIGKISLDDLPDMLKQYFYDQHFHITDKEHYDMSREIQKDMIALRQWMIDYDVELVFIEFPVYSHELQMATQIDVGAFVTIKEGTGKTYTERRAFAIIDYKSGKSGFYTEHVYQLYSNMQMFKSQFPQFTEHQIEIFNLAGKNWRSTEWNRRTMPYSFVNQIEKVDYTDYAATLKKAQNHLEKRIDKSFTYIRGEMSLTDDPKQFIVTKKLTDLVKEGDWKRFLKTSASIPEMQL